MSFRYQPTAFAPDPWPVDGPKELDNASYAAAIRDAPSAPISDIIAALDTVTSENVIVYLLFLGESYTVKGGTIRGYYIRGIVRDRERMRQALRVLLPRTPRGDPVRATAQLTLSLFMIPRGEEETRVKVVGWGFAEK